MNIDPLNRLEPVLAEIGAVLVNRRREKRSPEWTEIFDYDWRGRGLRLTWNVVDGLAIQVEDERRCGPRPSAASRLP